jgi:hypothetical protein
MKKNTFKFEVSFNLNTATGEQLDRGSIQDFKDSLEGFVRSWNGQDEPTAIKVKKVVA